MFAFQGCAKPSKRSALRRGFPELCGRPSSLVWTGARWAEQNEEDKPMPA